MKITEKKWFSFVTLSIAMIVIMILCPPVFYLNDDVAMRSILSGAYTGTPNGHAVYMKYPLTGVLALLYRVLGFVPWMELFFAFSILLCMSFFADCFASRLMGCVLALGIYMPFVLYMHYTLVAALLAATAIFLLVKGDKELKAWVLLLLSFLIRSQVGLLSLPFVLCAWVWRVGLLDGGQRKQEGIRMLKWGVIWIAAVLCCSLSHSICYSSPEWKEYLDYNDSRTLLYDYTNFLSVDTYGENCTAYGMTSTEYDILYNYNNMLDSSIDAQRMEEIADKVSESMKPAGDILSSMKNSVRQYFTHIRYDDAPLNYIWLGAVLILGCCCVLSKRWFMLGIVAVLELGRSVVWIYLIWKGRFPQRVSQSLYLLEILLLLGMLMVLAGQMKWSEKGKKIMAWGLAAVLLIACGIQWKHTLADMKYRDDVQQGWEIVKGYCEERPETIFFADVFSVVQYAESQYTRDCENIVLLGGWLSASPLSGEIFEKIGVADAGEALYDVKEVRLLAVKDRDVQWLEEYLQERFGPCELKETGVIVLQDGRDFAEYGVYPLSE